MKDKENKDKFQEPISDYQVNENSEVDSDEIHHVLKQLLEQSLKKRIKVWVFRLKKLWQRLNVNSIGVSNVI